MLSSKHYVLALTNLQQVTTLFGPTNTVAGLLFALMSLPFSWINRNVEEPTVFLAEIPNNILCLESRVTSSIWSGDFWHAPSASGLPTGT
jgi:hypothetical protein